MGYYIMGTLRLDGTEGPEFWMGLVTRRLEGTSSIIHSSMRPARRGAFNAYKLMRLQEERRHRLGTPDHEVAGDY